MIKYLALAIWMFALMADVNGQSRAKRVKQPREVVEAYRVCAEFQRLMAEDLDFDRAFAATFTKDPARRRQIAIFESELGRDDVANVDDATLLSIYKSYMQLFYLMLPLVSPADKEEEALFFPPEIKRIFERKPPKAGKELPTYALQLKRDVTEFRAHLNRLANQYSSVAERIRKFKEEQFSKKPEPPNRVVEPLTGYSKGRVLRAEEKYYQIDDFAVIREGTQMKIIGIRFFSRLF
jgi:hypothetical protein